MASHDLMKMLDTAIEIPHDGVLNLGALHKLLKAMIGQLGQHQVPVLEPGQSPTSCLGKDQDTKEQPGQEEEEDGAPGTGQQPQEPEEQLLRKDTLERTRSNAEITSMVKELTAKEEEQEICKTRAPLQDAAGQLSGLQDQLARDSDVEDSGGQSASAEPPELDVDTQHGENSARGPNGPETQPGTKISQGTPGMESLSLGIQAGSHRTPVTPENLGDVPSDQTRTSDASTTTTGPQPESLGTQVTTTGVEPGSPSTQATAPGMQTRSPGTKTTTLHTEPGVTGTQSTIPGMQPGSHSTQTIILGMQPGSPGTYVTTLEMEPGSPGTHATTPGMQSASPGTRATTPGMQPGSPGTHATTPGMQPGQATQQRRPY
ncbi:uncharacterized protein [Patagioenas fasciata]|uniref:uncharacterized protein n=1 Tax=Patagioenas fasciata TaxID=372321 RepID=UPI003A9981BD